MIDHDIAVMNIPAPFGWVGGKKLLSKRITSMIPPHRTYVEPFCGAASVFWAKEPSEVEVLNDLDPDLMRFYRDIGKVTHCDIATISQDWDRLRAKEGNLEVCELLAQVNCSFGSARGSKATKGSRQLNKCYNNAPQFHNYLPQYQERLRNAKLHNEDWREVVMRYDSPDTFFYLDPPYHGTSREYRYSDDQLARLAEVLPGLKGKWLLTYDDHPEVRDTFSRFNMMGVIANYTIQAGSNVEKGKQLMIANFPLNAKMGATDIPMLKYQYSTMLDQLILLQLHAEDPNCPCSLKGEKQGEIGEYCEPKHLRAVVALARETIPMESDGSRLDYLESLVMEGTELLNKMEQKLCGEGVDIEEYTTKARDWRKPLEEWVYSGFCEVKPAMTIADYVELKEAVMSGVTTDIGAAVITGIGVGAGFKIADWVVKKMAEGKSRGKEVSEMEDSNIEKEAMWAWRAATQLWRREQAIDIGLQPQEIDEIINKSWDELPPEVQEKLVARVQKIRDRIKAITGGMSDNESRRRILKALRHYRSNKKELEHYFDYGEDTDRIQSEYSTTWLESAILGFAMRLDWTPADLEKELDWVCGVGPEPRYKGASTHPMKQSDQLAEGVRMLEGELGQGKRYMDFAEGKRIWELAVKMKEEGKELDESATGKDISFYDLSPGDQATWYAGSYFADKEGNIAGRSKLELADIYAELVRDIDELRGVGQEGTATITFPKMTWWNIRGAINKLLDFEAKQKPRIISDIEFGVLEYLLKRIEDRETSITMPRNDWQRVSNAADTLLDMEAGLEKKLLNHMEFDLLERTLVNMDEIKVAPMRKKPLGRMRLELPSEVIIYKTTIEKHYLPSSAFHKGSIRVVKPEPHVLVYLGCLKKDKWDASKSICSPNPTIVMSVVPNTKKYRDQLDHLILVHPEVKVTKREKEVGTEPRMGIGEGETVYVVVGVYKGIIDQVGAYTDRAAAEKSLEDTRKEYGIIPGHEEESENSADIYEVEIKASVGSIETPMDLPSVTKAIEEAEEVS